MSFQNTNPRHAHELLSSDEGWTYLDVRTPEEFEQGHPEGSFNVPVALRDPHGGMRPNDGFLAVIQGTFAKETRLVVGCAAGGRSMRACEILASAGFSYLVNVRGGYHGARDASGQLVQAGWQAEGLPSQAGDAGPRAYEALRSKASHRA